MLPVVPFLCVTAAVVVAGLSRPLARGLRLPPALVAAALAAAVVWPSAESALRFDRLMRQRDSRLVAGDWVLSHVPAGATIYQAGSAYGHLQLEESRPFRYPGRLLCAVRRVRAVGSPGAERLCVSEEDARLTLEQGLRGEASGRQSQGRQPLVAGRQSPVARRRVRPPVASRPTACSPRPPSAASAPCASRATPARGTSRRERPA